MSSLSNIEEDQVTDRSSVTRSLIASQASLRSQVDVEKEKDAAAAKVKHAVKERKEERRDTLSRLAG